MNSVAARARPQPTVQVEVAVGVDRSQARAVPDDVVVRQDPRRWRADPRVVGDGLVDRRAHRGRVPSGLEVVEVERGVQLVRSLIAGHALGVRHPRLAAEHPGRVVLVGDRPPFPEDGVHAVLVPERRMRDVLVEHRRRRVVPLDRVCEIGQARLLDQPVRHVDAESVDAAVEPEPQRVDELPVDVGVVPVDVGLRGVEQVQVPVAGRPPVGPEDRRPPAAVEHALPVVRGLLAVGAPALAHHVPIPRRRTGLGLQQLLEPAVLAASVVGHDVHEHADTTRVRVLDEGVDIGQRAEAVVDGPVVGDVVAAVIQRRGVEG